MKLSYDKSVDAAYLRILDSDRTTGPVSTYSSSSPVDGGMINLDFDGENRLLGIELIPASVFLHPSLLKEAD